MSLLSNAVYPPDHASVKCGHVHIKPKISTFIGILEKISAIALGIFAALTDLKLFIPFFITGVAIGIYNYFENKENCENGHSVSSCSLGVLEQFLGVKLPSIVSLAANIAGMVCHIDHHSTVFVPIVAISIGVWVGQSTFECGSLLYKKFTAHAPHNSQLAY